MGLFSAEASSRAGWVACVRGAEGDFERGDITTVSKSAFGMPVLGLTARPFTPKRAIAQFAAIEYCRDPKAGKTCQPNATQEKGKWIFGS